MTKPKRTIATTLLCLCIIPLLAVPVFADKDLDTKKKELGDVMAEAEAAVKGNSDLQREVELLRREVKTFINGSVETSKLPELKAEADDLLNRVKDLRDKAKNSRPSGGQGNNQMSREQIERQVRQIRQEAEAAYTSAEKAAQPAAAEDAGVAERVKKLKEHWESFDTIRSKTNTADELEALVGEKNKLIAEANTLKADVGDSGPGILDGLFSLFTLGNLLRVLLALVTIAALACAGWFLLRLHWRVGDLENLRVKDVQRFKGLERTIGEQGAYAQTVNSGVTRLREDVSREMEELRRSYRDMRTGQRPPAAVAPEPFERAERVPVRDPGPTFPSLVSDYLSKIADSKKVEVEADFRTNLFVPAPGGPFVLVQDDDGTGSGIVLPKSRLQKGQEFVSYYKGTYYCDSPSAGEVFVVEPAVVDQASGGWRLRNPGRLELK